jgi:PTH1 family peptidyl-tRNA hydrolase
LKYLIAGLGNIGDQYCNTRHNVGFQVLDSLAATMDVSFHDRRYGFVGECKFKGRIFILLKPSTYVNRSGLAINYWLKKSKLTLDRLLVVTDDVALPFGSLRIKPKGGAGGHNGLENIISVLATSDFARLRFGIGNDYPQGRQVDYVLGEWSVDEQAQLPERLENCHNIIQSFGTIGLELTMSTFNKK